MKYPRNLERGAKLVLALLLSPAIAGFAETPVHFKQLAGPPAEFSAMAPPDPMLTATHSKSALLQVRLHQSGFGPWTWRSEFPVEGETLRFAVIPGVLGPAADSWKVMLQAPTGTRMKSTDAWRAERRIGGLGFSNERIPAEVYELENLAPGSWKISIESHEPGRGFILLEGAGSARLMSNQTTFNQRVGQHIGLIARVYDRDDDIKLPGTSMISEAVLYVTTPNQQALTRPMFDDGLHRDGDAGDGVYGGEFLADREGDFNVQVFVKGHDGAGLEFVRTAEHLIPIVADSVSLNDHEAASRLVSTNRLEITLEVTAPEAKGHFRAFAEVWGKDRADPDVSVPVAWIGGMTILHDEGVKLGLDTRWIQMSTAQPPFELRNVRIEDPGHFITLASAGRIAVAIPVLRNVRIPVDHMIVDEEMLMGPRPAKWSGAKTSGEYDHKDYTLAEGHKLLLVHGYCSSNVWGNVADQFDNASIFEDLDQNREVGDFAFQILIWAQTWNSYAIVAHSQGGMAALHLYAYYWSGLDNAGAGRLIQSVGTPYQGTNLAGILGVIGSWVGVGCGSNDSLTYSGAATWLAAIPSFARAEVNYYTTSFTDVWWWYDYCDPITDLFLDDPDDGVVERAKAQLAGGVNWGHTTGQCHSDDMRDPAQFRDSARNATMSTTAAIGPPPAAFHLTDPTNGYDFDSETLSVTLSWGWALNATSYDVYFGTSPNPPLVANETGTSLMLPVTTGETYYWTVQAENLYGSTWSSSGTWNFSVGILVFSDGFESGNTSAWSGGL